MERRGTCLLGECQSLDPTPGPPGSTVPLFNHQAASPLVQTLLGLEEETWALGEASILPVATDQAGNIVSG